MDTGSCILCHLSLNRSVWQVKVYLFLAKKFIGCEMLQRCRYWCWRYTKKTTTKDKLQYACKPLWIIVAGIEYHALTHTHTHSGRKLSNCTQSGEFIWTLLRQLEKQKKNKISKNAEKKRVYGRKRERDRKPWQFTEIAEEWEWDTIKVECLLEISAAKIKRNTYY